MDFFWRRLRLALHSLAHLTSKDHREIVWNIACPGPNGIERARVVRCTCGKVY
jgi:hypothetical protein